ncbi:hypothetical protein Btru_062228 [Bulinus truncatus]|nr:hypothetical protein Btru_062228 [Bulinus truncatus]
MINGKRRPPRDKEFQLGARQNEEAFNTFRVIPESGYIVTLRDLTALQGETMKLVVEAVDGGAKSLTAQAMVNIHILDSINNAPTIRLTIPYGQRVTTITENAAPGLVVAHFIVDDPDSGENGVVTCHLHDDTFGLQRLKEAEYKVTVYSVLDRERVPFYDVTVTCSDGGHPPMSTNIAFSVILDDANDNPPRFLRSLYLANVTENNPGGFVLKVEADDIDVGQNGKVTYRLGNVTSLVASYIHVNSTTGDVKTKQMLDHELFRELDFYVVAMDDGSPSMSSSARIVISVIDENDNRPKVPSDFYLSVGENSPPRSLVGYINAIDPDKGPAGEVAYQLLGNDYTGLFDVSETGEVRALVTFDRELRDVYDITVLARDFGAHPLDNVLGIRIIITDTNDHYPQFLFPTKTNKTAHITIDARFNATVAQVSATDQDLGKNGTLTYTITSYNNQFFEIDSNTGRIFVTRQLFGPDKGTYDIQLFVRDNGFPTLSNTSSLTVIVTQGNTTAIFSAFGYHEQMIIVAVLVAFTVSIAVVVFLIVLRFVKKDRRDRRPKYTSGLPMEIKKRSPTPEDDVSSDEGPWRRYDEAKRPNGPVMTSGDVSYDANDDIIMFKLKLADQYRELEPEDKVSDHCMDTEEICYVDVLVIQYNVINPKPAKKS